MNKLSKDIEEKECVICKKKFLRRTKKMHKKNGAGVRGYGTKTCSKKCSLEFNSTRYERLKEKNE